jgi:hypothetical protein
MSNNPNMSYCAVENTNASLGQVLSLMENFDSIDEWFDSLNENEKRAWHMLEHRINELYIIINDDDDEFDEELD